MSGTAGGPLLEMARTTPTALWSDSADPRELARAIGWGAVGATCNPVLALAALRADAPRWTARIAAAAREEPEATESALGWRMVRELSQEAAALLEDVFGAHAGRNGRVSVQTDPRLFRSVPSLVAQAREFDALAPNVIVKIPATATGVAAMEAATYAGVSVNATVSFTVAQALAVAEAVERGLRRRDAEGSPTDGMGPVCTIMLGRLDDWLRVVAAREGLDVDPGHLDRAGIAAFKRAHGLYRERGYRTRLLAAAFRTPLHWSELVGGDVVISPPFAWQERIQASGARAEDRIGIPVGDDIVASLSRLEEFRRAYEPDGLAVDEFESYGATRRTLRQFLAADADLDAFVRDVLLPDAD